MVRHGLSDIPLTELNKEKDVNDLLVSEVIITHTHTHTCAGPILCRPELSWPWRFVANVSCYQKSHLPLIRPGQG